MFRVERGQAREIQRMKDEYAIVSAALDGLLEAGYRLGVRYDAGDDEIAPTADRGAIEAALFECDEEWITVYTDSPRHIGWVKLVYGNGLDVISDYTLNIEAALAKANALAEQMDSDG